MTFKQYVLVAATAALFLGLLAAAQGGSFVGSNGLIAFTCGSNVCTVSPDGSGLATVASSASDPSWSADGTKLAYVGGGGITLANANGGEDTTVPLTSTVSSRRCPASSRVGTRRSARRSAR